MMNKMTLTRRTFLIWMGITTVGLGPHGKLARAAIPEGQIRQGRTLVATPLLAQPRAEAAIIRICWPDSILDIRKLHGAWFEVPGGYVAQSDVQPMVVRALPALPEVFPFWAEVVAPVSAIRAYAAADAPLVARIGHGGVLRVTDYLPGEPAWYALADSQGDRLGWAQAGAWASVGPVEAYGDGVLYMERSSLRWTLEQAGQPIGTGTFAAGSDLTPGRYPARRLSPGGQRNAIGSGASWRIGFGEQWNTAGVYWHHQFGRHLPGPAVQLPPAQARWCYECLAQDGMIVIE